MSAIDKIRSFAESRMHDDMPLPEGSLSYGDVRALLGAHWQLYRVMIDDAERYNDRAGQEIARLRRQRKVYRREIRRLQKALENRNEVIAVKAHTLYQEWIRAYQERSGETK